MKQPLIIALLLTFLLGICRGSILDDLVETRKMVDDVPDSEQVRLQPTFFHYFDDISATLETELDNAETRRRKRIADSPKSKREVPEALGVKEEPKCHDDEKRTPRAAAVHSNAINKPIAKKPIPLTSTSHHVEKFIPRRFPETF